MKKLILALMLPVMGISLLLLAPSVSAAVDSSPDCDTVAIIHCGVSSEADLQAKAKQGDVPKVFSAFGIQQNELNGFVDGVVWKDGRVTVGNDRVVATKAVTAGRWNNPTSDMTKISGTDRAYKMSTSHFVDEGQVAYIKIVNGKFQFAVIKTCGNPVTATPKTPEKPQFTVTKDAARGVNDNNWRQSASFTPGEYVAFRVTVKNTGNTVLKNVHFRDTLPQGLRYDNNVRSILNGKFIINDLSDGMNMGDLQPGSSHVLMFAVLSDANETRTRACSPGLTNKAFVKPEGATEKSDTAVAKICAPAAPAYRCNAFNIATNSEDRTVNVRTFTTTERNGATFKRLVIDWGDGTSTSVEEKAKAVGTVHQFSAEGTYVIKANVVFVVQGKEVTVAAAAQCTKTVTFEDEPAEEVQAAVVTTEEAPPEDEPEPKELVDTGPGAVIGLMFSTITGGALAYRYVWLRRNI